jgi:hypothetical protein
MYTISGQQIDVTDPQPEQINVWDIAWSLSHINRYLGHTPVPWDVLSHTGLCYMLYKADTQAVDTSPGFELALLLHDAAEAYVGDMLHMTKKLESLDGYRCLEDNVSRIIYQRFGINYLGSLQLETDFPGIKRYDQQAAHVEFVKLIPAAPDLAQLAKQYELDVYPPLIKAKVPDFVEFLKDRAINAGVTNVAALFERPESLVPYLDEAPAPARSEDLVERVEPLHSVADVENMHL